MSDPTQREVFLASLITQSLERFHNVYKALSKPNACDKCSSDKLKDDKK